MLIFGEPSMPIDRFYKNSFILTASNLVTVIIGFIFSILLSRELGAEGLGLYGLIMPIYGLLLCLTSEGLVTAISRISTIYFSRKDFKNLNKTVSVTFSIILIWSVLITVIAFFSSSMIGTYIVKDKRCIESLRIICPALLFVALSAIFKGYFYGIGQYKITSFIDMLEKLFRVVILYSIIAIFSFHTISSTVAAACFTLVMGEFISFTLLYAFYKKYRKKYNGIGKRPQRRLQLLFNVLVISGPLCLNGFASSILNTISTLIIPQRLMYAGFSYNAALSLIGKFSGMALNITYLPFVLISSMMTVLVPDLSLSQSKNDFWAMDERIMKVLKFALLVGIATLVIIQAIPDLLGRLFYNRIDLGGFIKFASITSAVTYLSSPTFGILNGLGKQKIILRNSLIISIQSLVLVYLFTGIPKLNIYGCGIAMAITSLTAFTLNIYEIKKITQLSLPVSEIIFYMLIGVFSFFVLKIFCNVLSDSLPVLKAISACILGFFSVFSLSRIAIPQQFKHQ
jgi:stage V sporulation protein B